MKAFARGATEVADEVSQDLRRLGFAHVAVDLRGFRSGSLNDVLPIAPEIALSVAPTGGLITLAPRDHAGLES